MDKISIFFHSDVTVFLQLIAINCLQILRILFALIVWKTTRGFLFAENTDQSNTRTTTARLKIIIWKAQKIVLKREKISPSH